MPRIYSYIKQNIILKIVFVAMLQLLFYTIITAQKAKESSKTGSDRYIELKFQNDFFYKTDRYFSNGLVFNFVFPKIQKSPLSKILIPVKKASLDYYGISFVQELYTPTRTDVPEISVNDRPYSSVLYLGHKRTSFIAKTKSKISNELIVGIIGSYSYGYETQAKFHEAINNNVPAGWDNQVANDLVLNYNYSIETELFSNNYVELLGNLDVRAGTLHDDILTGFKIRAGWFNPNYSGFGQINTKGEDGRGLKKFQSYIYVQPAMRAVFYNATLQGGMFNKKSPVTMNYRRIAPFVGMLNSGFVLQYANFQLKIESSMLTKEFEGGLTHRWASVGLQVNF
jgi:hypothetical protein